MSLLRFEKKQGTLVNARSEYKLRAEIVKNLDNSILVRKTGTKTVFWIDKNDVFCPLIEGSMAVDFAFTINTYIGKEDGEDVHKTKLRLTGVYYEDLRPIEKGYEFQGGKFVGVIKSVTVTEMRGLYILNIRKINTGEHMFARYYSPDEIPVADVNRELTITINLIKTKSIVSNDGRIFEKPELREVDGELKTFLSYVPMVEVLSIVG